MFTPLPAAWSFLHVLVVAIVAQIGDYVESAGAFQADFLGQQPQNHRIAFSGLGRFEKSKGVRAKVSGRELNAQVLTSREMNEPLVLLVHAGVHRDEIVARIGVAGWAANLAHGSARLFACDPN